MVEFNKEYLKLNNKQRQAVDTIDGPLLVVAGPGTGKTQLLSMRVANLLQKADITPNNILCITFTDNAARNMRDRLETIIGQAAYHVGIYTFHSFGTDIINQYPAYFTERALLQSIDDLGSYEILRSIFETLAHNNPLSTKVGDEYIYLKDTQSTISWLKQNALKPEELMQLLKQNEAFMEETTKYIAQTLTQPPSTKLLSTYKDLASKLSSKTMKGMFEFSNYGAQCVSELLDAIDHTDPNGRFAPAITSWRNNWFEKNNSGDYQFKDNHKALQKMKAVAVIYKDMQDALSKRGLFDFDDMIMEVVHALEKYDELKFNLQERYQYILIDEFQDTNKAQMRIIKALGDNPVNEGRPNIMAVGDDDQAIYGFQGAQSSNMLDFLHSYNNTELVALTDNYRSTQSILDVSRSLVTQADNRLETEIDTISKDLVAHSSLPNDIVEQNVLPSELQQYQWIAEKIDYYIKQGTEPREIAVIAPKHKYLERLMPYIGSKQIPVAYERRENILDAPIIKQITTLSELTDALARNDHINADALMAEVLSFEFWQIKLEDVAALSIESYDAGTHWIECMLKSENIHIKKIATWILEGVRQSHLQPLEYMLDRFIGNNQLVINSIEDGDPFQIKQLDEASFHSPMREYYFNDNNFDSQTDDYLALLGQLSTLRHRLRSWQPDRMLLNKDFVEFVRLHREAKLKIIDTNPHTQTTNAVQVMTAHKAKGLEFDIVFVINAQDEVWGPSARTRSDRIRIPRNLPIKPLGQSTSDKVRLFYVALSRSKHTLHITSYTHSLDNKLSLGLSFVGGNNKESTPPHQKLAPVHQQIAEGIQAVEILTTDWAYRFRDIFADKPTLLQPILKKYKLSVTHLNNFLDIANAGPHYFLVHNLLRFPEAMTPNAAYGDAIHKTLQWIYAELRTQEMPSQNKIDRYFCDILQRKHLPPHEFKTFSERGVNALYKFITERSNSFNKEAIIERGFSNEGSRVGEAILTGKIDKIELEKPGIFCVTDFKTGNPAGSWKGKYDYERIKLHKYRQQLMFYKLLIERSASFGSKYIVISGKLEFIEAADSGNILAPLQVDFDPKELQRFETLIRAVWHHIQTLNFPDAAKYNSDFNGLIAFENDLMTGIV